MSEQSQGPGWWKASDGKWYPPEQAPAAPPPSTEPIAAAPPAGTPVGAPFGPPGSSPPGAPPPGAPPGGPPTDAPPAPGPSSPGNNTPKIIAVIVTLALVAGGIAFAVTRGGGSGGSAKAFCDTAKKFQNDDSLNNAFNNPAEVDKALAAFDELVKAAPKEIKTDMETLQDALKKIGLAIKTAGNDPGKQFAAVLAASQGLDEKKLDQATKNIEEFGKKNCGSDFTFGSSGSSRSSAPGSSTSGSSFGTDFSFDSDSFSSVLSEFSSNFGSDFLSSLSSEFSTSS